MLCCPQPESGHLFCWSKKPKERVNSLSTPLVLKHRNHQCAAGRHSVYRERTTLHRPDHHYNFNETFLPWNKTLRGDDRSNSDGPFWCSPPHCRTSKKPTLCFYLPPCAGDYNFHITAVTNERQYIKQNLSAPENSAPQFSERVLKPAAYCHTVCSYIKH